MASKASKPSGPGRRAQPMRSSKASAPWPNEAVEVARSDTFAIMFFADAITALPREVVRHLTLLREVDAKIFLPEATLLQEVEEALEAPLPEPEDTSYMPLTSAPRIRSASLNGHGSSIASPAAVTQLHSAVWSNGNLPRRHKFRDVSHHLQEMLLSLDEKNHVISTAVEAINKELARLDDCYPMIGKEISEEARFGSVKHWAYEENRVGRSGPEKSRREAADSSLTAAQQGAAEEIAVRSETRKLAVQAKKGKNHHIESDFDDHNDNRKPETTKKLHGNSKIRKAAQASLAVGLGITNGASVNGNPPAKRRKVEKPNSNASGTTVATNGAGRGKVGSPRETPMPEAKKRGKAPTTNGTHSRKRTNPTNLIAQLPSLQSSPVHSTFAEAKLVQPSPAPTVGRPPSVRARQNSTHSILEGSRQRPASSASNRANGVPKAIAEFISATEQPDRPTLHVKAPTKEPEKGQSIVKDAKEEIPAEAIEPVEPVEPVEPKKDDLPNIDKPDDEVNGEIMQGVVFTNATPAPSTRAGRASKPSTPAIPSFPESMAGGRPGRASRNQHDYPHNSATNSTARSGSGKRSHKKGAGAAAAQQPEKDREHEQERSEQATEDVPMVDAPEEKLEPEGIDTVEGDTEIAAEEEVDEDEPRYCYCNGVSYGEMVACDADGCEKEWFHLGCVGLKVAPRNAKWYCEECKEKGKNNKRGRSSG